MPIHTESKCIVISQRLYLKSPNTEITMLSLRKAWNVSTLEPTHQFKGMTYMQHRWMPETSCRVSKQTVSILCTSPTEPGLPLTAGTVTWDLRGAGLLLHTCAFMLCSIIKIHRAILVKVWHYCTDYTPQEEWQWGAHSGISHSKERMTSSSKSSVWFAGACIRVHMCESRYVCQAYLWRSKVTQDRLTLSNKHTSCSSLEENDP